MLQNRFFVKYLNSFDQNTGNSRDSAPFNCQQFYFSSLKLFLVNNNYLAKLQLTSIEGSISSSIFFLLFYRLPHHYFI